MNSRPLMEFITGPVRIGPVVTRGPEILQLGDDRLHVFRLGQCDEVVPDQVVEGGASVCCQSPGLGDKTFVNGKGHVHQHGICAQVLRCQLSEPCSRRDCPPDAGPRIAAWTGNDLARTVSCPDWREVDPVGCAEDALMVVSGIVRRPGRTSSRLPSAGAMRPWMPSRRERRSEPQCSSDQARAGRWRDPRRRCGS